MDITIYAKSTPWKYRSSWSSFLWTSINSTTTARIWSKYPSIVNKFGHSPHEEASNKIINDFIESKTHDKINSLLNRLKNDGLAKNFVIIKHGDLVIGKKILRNLDNCLSYSTSALTNSWTLTWHGTKYKHLYSIMKHGLYPSGAALTPDHRIVPEKGHIRLNYRVDTIDNWANAIFVSPSLFYAAHKVYAERIFSEGKQWCVLVETRVKPGSFTQHKHTVVEKRSLKDEPKNVEYRVAVKSDQDFIIRVESERNVVVTAVVFINVGFLENIDEYYKGEDLFANSDAERALFQ